MIARLWRCLAAPDQAHKYIEFFEESVFMQLIQMDGFHDAYILQHPHPEGIELTVLTFWESMEAVRAFAGDDPQQAVVHPAAQLILKSYDSTVTNYEVLRDFHTSLRP